MIGRDLLGMEDISREDIIKILDTAAHMQEIGQRAVKKVPSLRGRTIVNLFFESSTRTRMSFEIAGKRLSADVVNFSASSSSLSKAESIMDTARTVDAMDPDLVVKKEDFARVLGQSTLLFLGEARVVSGCIKKPVTAKTWVDYCLLNDVHFTFLWERFLQRTEKGSLPEVDAFFGKSLTGEKNK